MKEVEEPDGSADEAHDSQSHAPPQPERRPDLREVLARQSGLEAAAARRPGSGHASCWASTSEKTSARMPEVSEIEIIRHFTRLSTWNYAIDLGMYPAGLLHYEVQPARQRIRLAHRRPGQRPSLPARKDFPGRAAHPQNAQRLPHRNHRHGRNHAPARRRRSRRTYRLAARPCLSPVQRQCPQKNSDPRFRPRHQSRHRRHRRLRRRKSEVKRARHGRRSRASRANERRRSRAHGHQSQHARRLRAATSTKSPNSCTPKAASSTWMAPT